MPTPVTTIDSLNISMKFSVPANENIDVVGVFNIYSQKPSAVIFSPQGLQNRNRLLDRLNIGLFKDGQNLNHMDYVSPGNYIDSPQADASGTPPAGSLTKNPANACSQCGRIHDDMPAGAIVQVRLLTSEREELVFNFAESDSSAAISGSKFFKNYRMQASDSSGKPVALIRGGSFAYYDLYIGGGYIMRYSYTTGQVIALITPSGREIKPDAPSVGLAVIYDEYDIIPGMEQSAGRGGRRCNRSGNQL